jgi:hypothetical protein
MWLLPMFREMRMVSALDGPLIHRNAYSFVRLRESHGEFENLTCDRRGIQ